MKVFYIAALLTTLLFLVVNSTAFPVTGKDWRKTPQVLSHISPTATESIEDPKLDTCYRFQNQPRKIDNLSGHGLSLFKDSKCQRFVASMANHKSKKFKKGGPGAFMVLNDQH